MKTKPVIIIVVAAVILVCGFLFIRSKYLSKPEKGEITQFLNAFNAQIQAGNIDSASLYFEEDQKGRLVKTLLKVLTNKTNTGGKEKPIFKVSLNTEAAAVKFINPELATANVIANFNHQALPAEKTILQLTIHKIGNHQYKISQVNATDFVKSYAAFQNRVINKTIPEKDIYSPMTLAAFKVAEQLKTHYDDVLWFDHINNKTFYYVIKGKADEYFYSSDEDKKEHVVTEYKMGLVNPDLKEIIPVEYDMIHNVGGTIEGLIEVEKNHKRGFYSVNGKLIVPADYNQIFPLKDDENLALLKNGDDYFYLKADSTISDKISDFKIADVLPKIKTYGASYTLTDKGSKNIMEYNSRDQYNSLIIPPSYLVDWLLLPKFIRLQNPLRHLSADEIGDGDGSSSFAVKFSGDKNETNSNWFQGVYYSVVDDYLGGRSGLYTTKNVLLVDKKQNRILGFNASSFLGMAEGGGILSGDCNENSIKVINDSLFEFKTTSQLAQSLLDSSEFLSEGPYYHYLQIKDGKLVPAYVKNDRIFPTQYVKLDDSYLQGCFVLSHYNYHSNQSTSRTVDHATPAILQLMKNEIYASYQYKFKNERWTEIFRGRFDRYDKGNLANVDDSLTTIDKYNISFINSKLNAQKSNTLAAK